MDSRAKRLRSASIPPPASVSSLSSPPQPHDGLLPPKRRGRKPGTLSRAAREAQRKVNHSLIEKARRTKINGALATLRDLVPPEYKHPAADDSDSDEHDPGKPKPKGSGEKEFKLEILVRTVAYLQDLAEKVKRLEDKGCPRCSEPISLSADDGRSRKRRRGSIPDDPVPSRCSSVAPPNSRLPSISAWLLSTAEDRRSSPSSAVSSATPTAQLPTPPTSAICVPSTAGFAIPPVLTLPSPSAFLPPAAMHMQPRFCGFARRPRTGASPLPSPVYTQDDETAASLLLRISTSASSPHTSPKKVFAPPVGGDDKAAASAGHALTPSRLLGLRTERSVV